MYLYGWQNEALNEFPKPEQYVDTSRYFSNVRRFALTKHFASLLPRLMFTLMDVDSRD